MVTLQSNESRGKNLTFKNHRRRNVDQVDLGFVILIERTVVLEGLTMISTIEFANETKMYWTFPYFETYRLFEDSVLTQDDEAYDTISSSSDDPTDDDDNDGEMSFILSSFLFLLVAGIDLICFIGHCIFFMFTMIVASIL